MCGPISAIAFVLSGNRRKRSSSTEIAQRENPQHENSLFNQAGLFAEVLHDKARALSIAREFIARFPQSSRAESAQKLILELQEESKSSAHDLDSSDERPVIIEPSAELIVLFWAARFARNASRASLTFSVAAVIDRYRMLR